MQWTVGFDADDTLWHNENIFDAAHARFARLLARYHDRVTVESRLHETEMRNLELYGYGVKGFTLSAVETALDLAGDGLSAEELRSILGIARDLLEHPVELLEGVREVLRELQRRHRLVVITKGDLRDQLRKLRGSGLLSSFAETEVVTEKDAPTYLGLLRKWGVAPERFLMVGNSLRSDVIPVLALGARAVWIPYPLTWKHEQAEEPAGHPRFARLESIRDLPSWLDTLGAPPTPPAR